MVNGCLFLQLVQCCYFSLCKEFLSWLKSSTLYFCHPVLWRLFYSSNKVFSSVVINPITRQQNFRLVIIETNCRRHFEVTFLNSIRHENILDLSKFKGFADVKIYMNLKLKGKKTLWKRRKCWLPAFSAFPTRFSKGFFFKVVKSQECVVKS